MVKQLGHPFGAWINIEIRRLMLRLIILRRIGEKRTYPYDILKGLSATPMHKMFPNSARFKNTVYNTISSLHREGYINSHRSTSGKVTKIYFTLTPKGKNTLVQAKRTFKSAMVQMAKILR